MKFSTLHPSCLPTRNPGQLEAKEMRERKTRVKIGIIFDERSTAGRVFILYPLVKKVESVQIRVGNVDTGERARKVDLLSNYGARKVIFAPEDTLSAS